MNKTASRVNRARRAGDKRSIVEKIALTAGALLLIVFTIIGMEFTLHGSHLSHMEGVGSAAPRVGDSLFVRTMESFTGTHLTEGNHVTVLLNGEQTYPAIWKELRGAKQTINLQMYFFQPGKIADTLSAILREKARSGVSVRLLMDAFGSQNITEGYLDIATRRGRAHRDLSAGALVRDAEAAKPLAHSRTGDRRSRWLHRRLRHCG